MICVKRGGISYCWNFETDQIEVYTKGAVSVRECPEDVIRDLMVTLSEKLKEKQRTAVGG